MNNYTPSASAARDLIVLGGIELASSQKVPRSNYLPGLDGLRAIAASLVICHHIEQISYLHGLPNRWDNVFFSYVGSPAVSLFFVLSGYLITFLLIKEIVQFGRVDFAAFYKRRALRIFPLYYFIVLLGFFIIPFIPAYDVPTFPSTLSKYYLQNLLMYLILCPQLAFVLIPPVSYAGALWSVGTEEWFYAVWPWVVNRLRLKTVYLCALIIIVISIFRYVSYPQTFNFLNFARFDCMAVGAIGSCVACTLETNAFSRQVLSAISRLDVQLCVYMTLAFALVFGYHFDHFEHLVFSILFLVVIMNVSLNRLSIFKLENRYIKSLGKISYGLYLYNWIAIVTVVIAIEHVLWFVSPRAKANLVAFGGVALTIVFAHLSYRYIEAPFLRLKRPYERKGNIDASGTISSNDKEKDNGNLVDARAK